jgi:hypothetical protein
VPAWRKFLGQFRDVLVILLLIATAISAGLWLVERDSAWPYEAIAIFAPGDTSCRGLPRSPREVEQVARA